jgi:hypothetical protein
MADFRLQLQGFPAANRDATVRLTQESTGTVVERKPFLDGSLLVRDLDPGFYQVQVIHPNLIQPIDDRRIRIFPQPAPTFLPIVIPDNLFTNNPIRDIPDADLTPVQQTATAVRAQLQPVGSKSPGETIRAADWNVLVGAVSDLAGAVLELTNLVSPRGHDHPEIAEKINEVQDNLRKFAEAFGRSLLQLYREIEAEALRRSLTDVLDAGNASQDTRSQVLGRVLELSNSLQSDTSVFTQKLSTTGSLVLTTINQLAVAQGANADAFLARPDVQKLSGVAQQYTSAGTQIQADSELLTYQRTTAAAGGKFGEAIGR